MKMENNLLTDPWNDAVAHEPLDINRNGKFQKFRIVVFQNGTVNQGSLIQVDSDSMNRLLIDIQKLLERNKVAGFHSDRCALRLFSFYGMEIAQVGELRDGDIVYASAGEGFLHPGKKRSDSNQKLVKLKFGEDALFYAAKATLKSYFPESLTFKAQNSHCERVTYNLDSATASELYSVQVHGRKVDAVSPTEIMKNLPLEMLEKILRNLTTSEALQYRCVSRRWRDTLTVLCRQRHVALRMRSPTHNSIEASYVLDLFEKSYPILWSSCNFVSTRDTYAFQKDLLHLYGPELLQVKLIGDNALFLRTLRMTPFVTNVHLEFAKEVLAQPVKKFNTCTHFPLSLPHLSFLTIELVEDSVVDEVEFLLCTCRLKSLKRFKTKFQLSTVDASRRMVTMLTNIRQVEIELQFAPATASAFRTFSNASSLNLHTLRLRLEEPPIGNLNQFRPVERLLRSSANTLEALSLCCTSDVYCGSSPVHFEIPPMPRLKTLEFTYVYHGLEYMQTEFLSSIFAGVGPDHFPVLEKVVVQESCHVRRFGLARAIFREANRIESVRELVVNVDSLPDDSWSKVFPNVEKFTGTVGQSDLVRIFKNLTKLKHLSLDVHNCSMGSDLNTILSGVPSPSVMYANRCETLTVELIMEIKKKYAKFPGLHSLPNLDWLSFNFRWPSLTDAGAYLAFLPLPQLQHLSLVNTNISDECETLLRKRHPRFVRTEPFGLSA